MALLTDVMQQAFDKYKDKHGGKNASYIPYLAQVPSELTGIAFVSVDGEVTSFGDSSYHFAIESISKVITLALALEESGSEAVHSKIGADPTGLPFNSVLALEMHNGKPLTPLVNAGAIATVSLIKADDKEQRWKKILDCQSRFANSAIQLSEEVNQSEQTTNTHNQAISLLLKAGGNMYSDPLEACDVYTRQCSTLINCVELATIGATLANGGFNPCSKQTVIHTKNVSHVLADMMMEGLYERSGDWAYDVGVPGKSGVGGGLVAVIPNVGALAAFSPPLDPAGNSVKGQLMIKHICHLMGWNMFNTRIPQ
ncbi:MULTISPECIES: glutaminase A [unclassified Shewanella]|uniref:glutaminase A n=1 Tax=unclassified Shewanella TaxID=196818 RepID=UPI001BC0EE11|nr:MULTISPECIES: glutaminase A [unclassified Shewanella]GIU08294.1 glutaminase 1 [Shewanella sp. MBTL60-112-B1]GIU35183.1 glutaminase 1 [Shewanella sp. MBTL60-112-B2]